MSITFHKIQDKNDKLEETYSQYSQTFLPEERRNQQQFYQLIDNPHAGIYFIRLDSKQVGYIVIWELSNSIFIEHFEIFSTYRGQQIGEKVLQQLKRNHPFILLETEPAEYGEIAQCRIKFYQRNGFHIIDSNHVQPPYEKGKQSVILNLMATQNQIHLEDLKKEIYTIVYS